MPEQGEYAYIATLEALKTGQASTRNTLTELKPESFTATTVRPYPVIESVDILREKKDTMMIGSGYIFQSMNSTVSMNLSVIFRLKGINFTVSGACASGSHAIGLGLPADNAGAAGVHHLRRRPGDQPGVDRQIRCAERFFQGNRTR